MAGCAGAVAGQSGVGKSSLLNAVDPELEPARAGREPRRKKAPHDDHRSAVAAGVGGYVVDTPGIRQFQLWDVIPAEVAGYFRDLRPYINHCRFPIARTRTRRAAP